MRFSQQGIVLIIVLIFLFVLALLSVSALHTSQLQVHMSYNVKDSTQALQAAEAGLTTAEQQLPPAPEVSCFSLKELPVVKGEKPWLKLKNTCSTKFGNTLVKYFIEQLDTKSCRTLYKITAWTNEDYPTIVQNVYAIKPKTSACQQELPAAGQLLWRELD